MSENNGYEPRIVGFLCNWCSYAGADGAGTARIKYPSNMRVVRVSPELVLRTFRQGADGVIVLGCHIGDCHYAEGNHRTAKRMPMLRNLLGYAGIHPDRLRLDWASAAEGSRLAEIVTDFTERIKELGKLETK
jgi:F420-non-reducing hydrogenase iron-sulfur subunit